MKPLVPDQRGLIPLLISILIAVIAVIVWGFLRVKGASS